MNDLCDLHINTYHHSEVYCGYFRRLVFGNSFTFSHIPLCFHAKPPNFPRLIGPRVYIFTKHDCCICYTGHQLDYVFSHSPLAMCVVRPAKHSTERPPNKYLSVHTSRGAIAQWRSHIGQSRFPLHQNKLDYYIPL